MMNAPRETSSLEPPPAATSSSHMPDLEKQHHGNASTPTLGDLSFNLEKLGRQRPAVFGSTFREVIFCSSLLISMLIPEFFISGFNIIPPNVLHTLKIPTTSQI